jgi:hypothetical protein
MNDIIKQIDDSLPQLEERESAEQIAFLREFTRILKANQRDDGGVGVLLADAKLDKTSQRFVIELLHPDELEYRNSAQPKFMEWYCGWVPKPLEMAEDEWPYLVLAAGCFRATTRIARRIHDVGSAGLPSKIMEANTALFVALSNDAFIGSHPPPPPLVPVDEEVN